MIDFGHSISKLARETLALERQVRSIERIRPDADAPAGAGGQTQGAVSHLVVGWCVLQDTIDRQGPGVLGLEPKRYAQSLDPDIASVWKRLNEHAPLLLALELRDRINWLGRKLTEVESIMPLSEICSLDVPDSANAVGAARAFCDFWILMSDTRQLLAWAEARSMDPMAHIPDERCPAKDIIRSMPMADMDSAFDRLIQVPQVVIRPLSRKPAHRHDFTDFSLASLVPELSLRASPSSSSVFRVRELFNWAVNYWSIHINPDESYGV